MLRVNLEYKKQILFIRLKGNLNEATSGCCMDYTIPVIKDYNVKYLILNIDNLSMIDDYGYKSLRRISNIIRNNNGKTLLIDKQHRTFNNELLALDFMSL